MLRRAIVLAVPVALLPVALVAACARPATTTAEPAPAPGAGVAPSTWLVTGAPGSVLPTGSAPSAPVASLDSAPIVEAAGTFLPWRPGSPAVTYDPKVVPSGSTAKVTISSTPYGTEILLEASGMVPRRAYGAHLHTQPCTGVAASAGPHYQHEPAPAGSPADPAYANPGNEIWLDFTADAAGTGSAVSKEQWTFPAAQGPRSLVIHDKPGMSGARVACLTLS